MTIKWDDPMAETLAKALAAAMNVPVSEIEAHILRHRAAAKARFERHRQQWGAWIDAMKDVQHVLVEEAERTGYKVVRLYRDRASRNVAVLLQKEQVWNSAKGRMGRALMMVYPDGTRGITMERSISIKQKF